MGILLNFIDPLIVPQSILIKSSSYIKDIPYTADISLVTTIYNPTNINLTIFIVFYLLLTLIVVVKITDVFFGPLRLSTK